MSTISFFLNEHKPIIKRTFSVNEADYQHVAQVFSETGFLQYFPGLCFKLLSQQLKQNGINNLSDRLANPDVATLAGLVSNLNLAFGQACGEHDHRRTRSVCERASSDGGIATNVKEASCPGCHEADHQHEETTQS